MRHESSEGEKGVERSDTAARLSDFEARLGKFVDLESGIDFIGREALCVIRERGLRRELVGLVIEGADLDGPQHPWPIDHRDSTVGTVRAAAFSPRLDENIALAIVDVPANLPGTELSVDTGQGMRSATVADIPFLVA